MTQLGRNLPVVSSLIFRCILVGAHTLQEPIWPDSYLAACRGGFPVVSTIAGPASAAGLGAFAQCGAGGSLGCGFQAESSPEQFIIMMFLMSTADQMLPIGAVLLEGRRDTGGGRL